MKKIVYYKAKIEIFDMCISSKISDPTGLSYFSGGCQNWHKLVYSAEIEKISLFKLITFCKRMKKHFSNRKFYHKAIFERIK